MIAMYGDTTRLGSTIRTYVKKNKSATARQRNIEASNNLQNPVSHNGVNSKKKFHQFGPPA